MKNYINQVVFTSQDFETMFDHFSTLQKKGLNYNFPEYLKTITSTILCKTLTMKNVEILQPEKNLFKVCSEIVISKNSYHSSKPTDWFLYCTLGYF